jgi:uncharacterized protein YodC (DUF2158 family)
MSPDINAGDVVQLKSGGPRMTVSKVKEWNGAMTADCDWFEGNNATYGSFPVSSLKVVEEAPWQSQVGRSGTSWS